jgi:hypothetical protein
VVALLAAATVTLRAQSDSNSADTLCVKQGRFVGPCVTVHGRMQAYSNNIVLGIWPIGTNRLLKVVEDPKVCALPSNLGALLHAGNKIFADFVVRPLTPFRPGVLQDVCVASASNIRTKPDPLLRRRPISRLPNKRLKLAGPAFKGMVSLRASPQIPQDAALAPTGARPAA